MDVHWTGGPEGQWDRPVCEGGMSNGCPMDVHWTGGLDRTVGKAQSVRVGCLMDVPWMSIGQVDWTGRRVGQDSGTGLVCEGWMSNGRPMIKWTSHRCPFWTCGLDRTVGQARSVRVGCPMDVPWMSIGQVDSGTRLVCEGGMSNARPVDVHWTGGPEGQWDRLVCDGGMSNGHPMDIHWTGGLDRTVGEPSL